MAARIPLVAVHCSGTQARQISTCKDFYQARLTVTKRSLLLSPIILASRIKPLRASRQVAAMPGRLLDAHVHVWAPAEDARLGKFPYYVSSSIGRFQALMVVAGHVTSCSNLVTARYDSCIRFQGSTRMRDQPNLGRGICIVAARALQLHQARHQCRQTENVYSERHRTAAVLIFYAGPDARQQKCRSE